MRTSLFEFHQKDSPVYQANHIIEDSLAGVIPYRISFQGEKDLFKDPEFLRKIPELQHFLEREPVVTKTLSLADFIKEMDRDFRSSVGAAGEIPPSRDIIVQYLLLFSLSGEDEELERLVSFEYDWGNIAVQCKSTGFDLFASHIQKVRDR